MTKEMVKDVIDFLMNEVESPDSFVEIVTNAGATTTEAQNITLFEKHISANTTTDKTAIIPYSNIILIRY